MTRRPKISVELLEVTCNNKLTFKKHIIKLCRSDSSQFRAIFRLKNFLSFQAMMEIFVYSNSNYPPLVWQFFKAKSIQIIEDFQKRALQCWRVATMSYCKVKIKPLCQLKNLCRSYWKLQNTKSTSLGFLSNNLWIIILK